MQLSRRSAPLLLALLTAAVHLASARLIVNTTALPTPLAQVTALLGLPKEQLAMGVPDKDFLAVLTHSLGCLDLLVQGKIDLQDSLFALAVNVTSKVLEGPKDFILQGLGDTFVIKYPAHIPNLTGAFPIFNITDFPKIPWLNKSIAIKGFPTFDILNYTMSLLTTQIPLLNSKIILSNNFTKATIQFGNSTQEKA